ncbi:MAG: hypothetical protein KF764_12110 [Labilithrix sp.]|nr:hypothetical protein [Labilithrix sp.]
MVNAVITLVAVLALTGIIVGISTTFPRAMRPWVWLSLAEYLLCVVAQLVYSRVIVGGGDMVLYASTGRELANFLDAHFSWAAGEVTAMLFQQPSAFDELVLGGGGSNTASMYAICGWILFLLRGSEYAAHVCVAGFSLLGVLGIYKAFHDAFPECPQVRLFAATVLVPSTAFWTCTLHKEAFCIAGIGALLVAWRGVYNRRPLRVLICAPLGLTLIVLFRAPAVVPLFLGLVMFFVLERVQRVRGVERAVLGPVYFGLALAMLAVGMAALTRAAPALALDRLGETVALKQQGWSLSPGGSSFEMGHEADAPQSAAGQLSRVPLALINALFRPQLFDVNNIAALMSALEMTTITFLVIRAVKQNGLHGLVAQLQRSPFLMMCTIVTLVGCTFVGLATLNFGSLARYRVPFLPFYAALVLSLDVRRLRSTKSAKASMRRAHASRRRAAAPRVAASQGRGGLTRATRGSTG